MSFSMVSEIIQYILSFVLVAALILLIVGLFRPQIVAKILRLPTIKRWKLIFYSLIIFIILSVAVASVGEFGIWLDKRYSNTTEHTKDYSVYDSEKECIQSSSKWGEYFLCVDSLVERNPAVSFCFVVHQRYLDAFNYFTEQGCLGGDSGTDPSCGELLDGDHIVWKGLSYYGECIASAEKLKPGSCEALEDMEYRDRCLSNIAQQFDDNQWCGKMSDETRRDRCFEGFSY